MSLRELILIISVIIGITAGYFAGVLHESSKIELPDKAEQINQSFAHPDTLLGYRKNGVLHIELKSKKI